MKEVLQVAYLRHLQDFYLVESVKDGSIAPLSAKCLHKNSDKKPVLPNRYS